MHDLKSDIEKYLNGELTPAEMHALEKKALDDPFLADALEGGGSVDANAFSEDMQQLQQALQERVDGKKGRVIPLWQWTVRIAAGLLLIVVSGYIVVLLTKKGNENQLAKNTQKSTAPTPAKSDSIAPSVDSSSASPQSNYLSQADTRETAQASKKQAAAADRSSTEEPVSAASGVGAPAVQLDSSTPESTTDEAERSADKFALHYSTRDTQAAPVDSINLAFQKSIFTKKDGIVTNESKPASGFFDLDSKNKESKALRKESLGADKYVGGIRAKGLPSKDLTNDLASNQKYVVRGRVTSAEDSAGIAGVNVLIKGSETGTITDIEGNYEIELDEPTGTLVYSFIGLESTEESVIANTLPADVTMNEDVSQLSEVVVTGYGETEEVADDLTTFEMASPAGGKKMFKKYLEETIHYPQIALDNKIEGKVTVQFVVDTFGRLTDFKIVKGIGYGCDEEVIRLIREGPAWTPMKRNEEPIRGRVRVRMRFSLPEPKK